MRVSQGVQEAKLIKKVVPVYPEIARSIRQFGTVRLLAVIGKDGHIHDVQVLGGPAYLVTAAVAAVEQWVYKPTLLNGERSGGNRADHGDLHIRSIAADAEAWPTVIHPTLAARSEHAVAACNEKGCPLLTITPAISGKIVMRKFANSTPARPGRDGWLVNQ